jgi:pyrroloquinoline-quinone synthase
VDDAFVADLRSRSAGYWDKHPFQQAMLAGALTPAQIRGFVANRWHYQKSLPRKDAAVIANCPVLAVRRLWHERLRYHDGPHENAGGLADWLHLCDAVGLDRERVLDESSVVPGVRFAVDGYVQFCHSAHWTAGVASSLTELFAPDLMAARLAAFRRYYPWIDAGGLAYFERRCGQAPGEAARALEVVTTYCDTPELRAGAGAALTFKCQVLWAMLDAVDYAYRDLDQSGAAPRPGPVAVTPRLLPHTSLRWNDARGEWLMMLPESVVVLNETAAAVLTLCDGQRSLPAIVAALAVEYDGVRAAEVEELLRDLAGQNLVAWS